jgi:hypothetical protein
MPTPMGAPPEDRHRLDSRVFTSGSPAVAREVLTFAELGLRKYPSSPRAAYMDKDRVSLAEQKRSRDGSLGTALLISSCEI